MKILEKLDKLAGTIKILEELMNTTQTSQSPKLQRIFKGIQSVEKAHSAMKQAQQVQELMQLGKNRTSLSGNASVESVVPLLMFLLNNLATPEASEEETPCEM